MITSTAIAGNGNTAALPWPAGNGTIGARGIFGGATVKIQWCEKPSVNDADWFDVLKSDGSALSFTTQALAQVTLGTGYIRGVTTGAGVTTLELVQASSLGPKDFPIMPSLTAYLTAADARTLLATMPPLPGMATLQAASDDMLDAYALTASIDLDNSMNYQGRKFDLSGQQGREFPRIPYGTVVRTQLGLPIMGGVDVGTVPPAGIVVWDWDDNANDGQGGAVVPQVVKMACLYQMAWLTQPQYSKRLEQIRTGMTAQSIGTASETYDAALAAGSLGLGDRAQRIMEKYRLRSGRLL